MALFTDHPVQPPGRSARAVGAGWVVLGIAMVIGLLLAVTPSPYVIEKPGPIYNTIGTAEQDGEQVPLISVSGESVYPTEGSLDLLTVSLVGNPDNRPSWLSVAAAWLNPNQAVIPIDSAFPPEVSTKQREEQTQAQMVNSQQDAIAAALTSLGYDYPTILTVLSLPEDSPAEGAIEAGDVVVSVNGEEVADITALRDALTRNGIDDAASIGIIRDGTAQTVQVTPVASGEAVVVGINVMSEYDFPFDVTIELDSVGGPSAGMMFALGIIDTVTPGFIQGGENVAGTGTINQAGEVGPIGGIRQKLIGAEQNDIDWFLAPADNCDEVTGNVPDGMTVFSVESLDDALAALEAIRTGSDTDALKQCPLG
ncbi:MAG TPA: S16 family serine protease [Cryobacterium sp.]|nr:S16 family serine protease [Cryobacterium sp.]